MFKILPIPATALEPLNEMLVAIRYGLYPTLLAMWVNPSLWGIHRREVRARISRTFFFHVWRRVAEDTDQRHRDRKLKLISRRAFGVVLDVGAGLGHALRYLDPRLVTLYIACEPNKAMHPAIRVEAKKAGFRVQQCVIFPNPANELHHLIAAKHPNLLPGSVDTIISVLSFCSILHPEQERLDYSKWRSDHQAISQVIGTLLKPKTGKVLFHELVPNESSPQIRAWQRFWSPIRSIYFGGCRLDVPCFQILRGLGGWSQAETWNSSNEDPNTLFPHQTGELIKE
ncbi:hypothetical protein PTTG_05375 [Puccinia triticina 1-1 BBBD Race 1]|uniref:Methyltransferase type 11 domain-containing protein n=2 Tax=Puccinia triticina TaxID=208348 RepID=A0A0C4EX28_PUCT1|nr:uncharacterized protein PtA15_17A236 [Puccinia triticina]OAV97213.1 hypothetical protein PTTG_05375 [Puccinia triticina 1-1 BBBD Race 1]WAQ92754.1 hypothetical protein PtA15_17A236 [Puccinia triticina]WAR63650.1 hypothetical protein PtB15_17B251 [Puccinia triticina]